MKSSVIVQFRSYINVVWGTKVQNQEAFAYMKGFPATFFLTERRAIVVGEFLEKKGWLRKKIHHKIIFEAGLQHLKEYQINIFPEKKIFTGFISFHPHNQMGEGAIIQFLKMRPEIGDVIKKHLSKLNIKHPIEDTGIVMVDSQAPLLQTWLNERLGIKTKYSLTLPKKKRKKFLFF
ncbi:hypothetical protein DSAG12_02540 [Promethearchaeum syntrophicum]|uniref:Uncharacterized protein n=1 Tax=Promethearchaeum syntrophicum TaxID=2594042 RepID=A0A5B9DD62_9ARCH|nr:hypothetical protein [Candidatus Prometheoarchaeum syntrophicum]QEE16710.1 hypothetical protein DSAG12_02540 [Candidatus Prometheoarchaeum syntrophicum]